jgi:hemerythrin-like domain-containing protein
MNTATDTLRAEHDTILRMLDAAEQLARRIESGQAVSPDPLEGLLEFFKVFADRCHHGKEEDLLFPLLESKGLPNAGGPIGVMLAEHTQGRELIRRMAQAADRCRAGDQAAAKDWARAAGGYAALLREHIHKENHILFVIAERILTGEEQARLAADFEKLEVEKMGAGTHARLHRLMEELSGEIRGCSHVA